MWPPTSDEIEDKKDKWTLDSHILRHACGDHCFAPSLPLRAKASLNTSKNNSWHLPGFGMPGSSYHSVLYSKHCM